MSRERPMHRADAAPYPGLTRHADCGVSVVRLMRATTNPQLVTCPRCITHNRRQAPPPTERPR